MWFNKVFPKIRSVAAPLPEFGAEQQGWGAGQAAAGLLTQQVPWGKETAPANWFSSRGDMVSYHLTTYDRQTLREEKAEERA